MELFDAIKNRHCYRGSFKNTPVPREDLKKIVEAGTLAPSGRNMQTTSFVIVDDESVVEKISGLASSNTRNKAMIEAKAYIVCVIDKEPEAVYESYSFQVEDCATACENMLLAITALGYASVWVDGWLRMESRATQIGEWLNIPKDKKARVILPVGIPVEKPFSPEKKNFSERAYFNSFSAQ